MRGWNSKALKWAMGAMLVTSGVITVALGLAYAAAVGPALLIPAAVLTVGAIAYLVVALDP